MLFCLNLLQLSSKHYSPFSGERLGKFVNDAPKKEANCIAKSNFLNGKPRLLLFAAKDIAANSQLFYDYGGKELSWRTVRNVLFTFC